jgi:hypothetical protein
MGSQAVVTRGAICANPRCRASHQLIAKLPPSVEKPVLKTALLISFRDEKGNAKTKVYDRRDLPQEVLRLYNLTGAPLESGSNVTD